MNMFEIQREIFTTVANAVLAVSTNCLISNAFIYAPAEYPAMACVLSDDGTKDNTRDSSKTDNYRDITVTVDVYSNKVNGMKTEAESLMQTVIDTLIPLNFSMRSCKPTGNNASSYRISATFTASVGADGTIYTR